jgi:hypothetical protein
VLPPLTSGSYPKHSGKHMLAVRLIRFDPGCVKTRGSN